MNHAEIRHKMRIHPRSGIRLISIDTGNACLDRSSHGILSVAAVDLVSGDELYAELRWEQIALDCRALQTDGMGCARSRKVRLLARSAMRRLVAWLKGKAGRCTLMPLIRNDGAADLETLRPSWELLLNKPFAFDHHAVDVNNVMLALAAARSVPFRKMQDAIDRHVRGRLRKEKPAIHALGERHALRDAWWNVYAWQRCGEEIANQ